ncbi:MAG TPA: translesion error-prone DNA polymerase V autoproteolytic subunit [Bacteroidota bacterium]|nr:translesion error-prone DNA polymerase V autoproteolytic subunit [Bacteroidota bacterium]
MEDKDNTENIIRIFIPERLKNINLPLFLESVSAGFPSPADDYLEGKLDLNDFLIPNPPATFLVHVTGDSMIGAGIYSGDLLIVDRSVEPHNRNIVIAVLDGELTVKRLIMEKNEIKLVAENINYKPIKITEQMQFEIWGVVRTVIHSLL